MNGRELLDQLNREGATLEIVAGKPRVRGAKVSSELMAALKANRAAVLTEYERRRNNDRDRYRRVPNEPATLFGRDLELPETMREIMQNYVFRQGCVAHAWVMKQALEYFNLGVKPEDCEWRACVDLIAWQRQSPARPAVGFVSGLEDDWHTFQKLSHAARDIRQPETRSENCQA